MCICAVFLCRLGPAASILRSLLPNAASEATGEADFLMGKNHLQS